MGSKFTVEVWGKHFGSDEYSYLIVWQGDQYNTALNEFKKAKKSGYGCVTLSWIGE